VQEHLKATFVTRPDLVDASRHATGKPMTAGTTNVQSSAGQSNLGGTPSAPDQSSQDPGHPGADEDTTGKSAIRTPSEDTPQIPRYVYLCIQNGRSFDVRKLTIEKGTKDQEFFLELKRTYRAAKGSWRTLFSTWRYDHSSVQSARHCVLLSLAILMVTCGRSPECCYSGRAVALIDYLLSWLALRESK
jgi:hypothetical protein